MTYQELISLIRVANLHPGAPGYQGLQEILNVDRSNPEECVKQIRGLLNEMVMDGIVLQLGDNSLGRIYELLDQGVPSGKEFLDSISQYVKVAVQPEEVVWLNNRDKDYDLDLTTPEARRAVALIHSTFNKLVNFKLPSDAVAQVEDDNEEERLVSDDLTEEDKMALRPLATDVLDSISALNDCMDGDQSSADAVLPALVYALKLSPGILAYSKDRARIGEDLYQINKLLNNLDCAEAGYYANFYAAALAGLRDSVATSEQILKYRVYAAAMPRETERRYYNHDFAGVDFFLEPKHGNARDQFKSDFYERNFELNDVPHLGVNPLKEDGFDDAVSTVGEKVGLAQKDIVRYANVHTQDFTVKPDRVIRESILADQDQYIADSINIGACYQPRHYLYTGGESAPDSLFLKVVYDEFPIKPDYGRDSVAIGFIPGPLEVVYSVEESGCQLVYFDTENVDLMHAMTGGRLEYDAVVDQYCDIEKVSYDAVKDILQDRIDQLGNNNSYAQHAQLVLQEVENVKNDAKSKVSETELKKIMLDTSRLISTPSMERAKNYNQKAAEVQKLPWGRILGGAMLALAGVVVMGLSIAAAVFTFGAASPISFLGFTLGASALGAGLSIAGAVVGAGVVAGSGFMLHSARRKPLRKSMEKLAEEVEKTKKPPRGRA